MADPLESFEKSFNSIQGRSTAPQYVLLPTIREWLPESFKTTEQSLVGADPVNAEPIFGVPSAVQILGGGGGDCGFVIETGRAGKKAGPRPARSEPAPVAQPGTAGTSIARTFNASDFPPAVSKTFIRSMLQDIEVNYLNGQDDLVLSQLLWLATTIGALEAGGNNEYQAFATSVSALVSRLRMGLDYFGLPQNYVPLLSVDFYMNQLDILLEHADAIEKAYQRIYEIDTDQQGKMEALTTVRASLESMLAICRTRSDTLQSGTDKIQETIAVMRDDLDRLFFELVDADNDFKTAVQNRSGGACSFVDMCMFVAAVVAVVYTGGAASMALVSTAKKVFSDPTTAEGLPTQDTIEVAKYLVRSVKPAGKSIGEFQAAYNEAKSFLSPPDAGPAGPSLPTDQAKLMIVKDDFDRQIAPFLSLPEAQKYKRLMHTYIDSAQARNNKIMELNSMFSEIAALKSMIEVKSEELVDVREEISENVDPRLPVIRTFLESASRESKSQITKLIYFTEKAFQFYTGRQERPVVSDRDVATLRASVSSIRFRMAEAKRGFGRPPISFTRKRIQLDEFLTESAWASLRAKGRFSFAVPLDAEEFRDFNLAIIRKIDFVFDGLDVPKRTVRALHHGKSAMRDLLGQRVDFSHQPVTALIEVDEDGILVSNGTISEVRDAEYAGVSPFGPWTVGVRVPSMGMLNSISGVTVFFDGAGFPTSGN